jgi:hypothetical protein
MPWQRLAHPNPFARHEPSLRSYYEKAFLEAFSVAAETTDDAEELWAYEQLKAIHRSAIAEMDDRAPSLLDAMEWAAQQQARRAPA